MGKRRREEQDIISHGDAIDDDEPLSQEEAPNQQDIDFIDKKGVYVDQMSRAYLWNGSLENYFYQLVFKQLKDFGIPSLDEQIQKHTDAIPTSQEYIKVITDLFAMKESIQKKVNKGNFGTQLEALQCIFNFVDSPVRKNAKKLLTENNFLSIATNPLTVDESKGQSVEELKGSKPGKKTKTEIKVINGVKVVQQAQNFLETKYPKYIANIDQNYASEYQERLVRFSKNTRVPTESYEDLRKQSLTHVIESIQQCIDKKKYQTHYLPQPPEHINLMEQKPSYPISGYYNLGFSNPRPLIQSFPPTQLSAPQSLSHQQLTPQQPPQTMSQTAFQSTPQKMTQTLSHQQLTPQQPPQTMSQTAFQSTPQKVSQSILQPTPQGLSQPTPQGLSQPTPQKMSQSILQPTPQKMSQPTTQSFPQGLSQSFPQPTTQSFPQGFPQPTTQSFPQPTTQSFPQGFPQPTTQKMSQSFPQPTTQSFPQGLSQSFPQPTTQSFPQPTLQSVPQPVPQTLIQGDEDLKANPYNDDDDDEDQKMGMDEESSEQPTFDTYQLRKRMTRIEKDLFPRIKAFISKDGFFQKNRVDFNLRKSQNIQPIHQAMFQDLKMNDYEQETQRFVIAMKIWRQYCEKSVGGKDEYKKFLRNEFGIQNPHKVQENVQYSAMKLQFWKSVTVLQIQRKSFGSFNSKPDITFNYDFVKTKWNDSFKSCEQCDKNTEKNKGSPMTAQVCDKCRTFFSQYGARLVATLVQYMIFKVEKNGGTNYFNLMSAKKYLIENPNAWNEFAALQLHYNTPKKDYEVELIKQIKKIIPEKTIFAVIYPIMSRVVNCFKLSQPNSKSWGTRLVFQQVVKANLALKQNQRLFGLEKYQAKKEYISCFTAPIFGLLQSWESASSKMVGTQGLRIWRFVPSSTEQKWLCGNDLRQQQAIKKFFRPNSNAQSDQAAYGRFINQLRTLFPIHQDCSQPTSQIFMNIMIICVDYVAGGLENNGRWTFSKTLNENPRQLITGSIKPKKYEKQESAASMLCLN